MPLNKSKGNMYPFVSHTWNAVKGKCPHDCSYCYMKDPKYNLREIRLDRKEFGTDLGEGNFIFVGSSCDMWAWDISTEWILETLAHNRKFPKNSYLYQSKNPQRFQRFYGFYPDNVIFGTTIESDREYPEIYKNAPSIKDRYSGIHAIGKEDGHRTMITIEPILDFDPEKLIGIIEDIEPEWVNIGADSQNCGLPEPGPEKIEEFILYLEDTGIEVKTKANLKRLML